MVTTRALSAFLLIALMFAPMTQKAWADDVTTTADVCQGQGATGNNPVDQQFQQTASAVGQQLNNNAAKIWQQLPKIDAAKTQCLDKFLTSYNTFINGIKGLTDPTGVVASLLMSQVTNLLNQTCSSVMGAVTGAEGSLSSLTRICLPLPSFNLNLNIPSLNLPTCSGGTSIQMITGSGPWSSPAPGNTFYFK